MSQSGKKSEFIGKEKENEIGRLGAELEKMGERLRKETESRKDYEKEV